MDQNGTFRDLLELKKEKFFDEKSSTETSREQINTENSIEKCFNRFQQLQCLDPQLARILRENHIIYLKKNFENLSTSFECLDSSRPWIVYWTLNAAHLINFQFEDELIERAIDFLIKCRNPTGGFGGGPGQYSHLATTYGAVNSLCIIAKEKSYDAINRETLMEFLWSVRNTDGAFRLHVGGETDVRGAYCAISCAKLCNFSKEDEEKIFAGTADWIASCQTYEGGFGGAPDLEAHGGYTFCGLAALAMLGCTEKCDVDEVLKWALFRQMRFEGGFQGRTNKLVDGCYSYWVGAIIPIAQAILAKKDPVLSDLLKNCFFDRSALQEYILLCCQRQDGGLVDKPGKPADPYHTCYTLSGISIAQHFENLMEPFVLGNLDNELLPTHPLHNVPPMAVMNAFKYFSVYESNMTTDNKDEDFIEINNDNNRSMSRETSQTDSELQNNEREPSVDIFSTSEFEEELSSAVTNSSIAST